METTNSSKAILILIALGIWALVLQNAGVIPTSQNVSIQGGYVNADVSGSVEVINPVEIDGTIDVNIDQINGYNNAFYKDRDGEYMVLPVIVR